MSVLKNYTSDQVVASLGAIPLNTGRGEGTFIKIKPKSPAFSSKVGADGETARSRSNDRRHEIEITTLQTSDANALLSTLHQLDLHAPNGAGVGALLIKDMSGTSLHAAAECWIVEAPEVVYAADIQERVWKLECADMVNFVGGN
jgi:structural protein KPP10_ORF10